MKRMIRWAFFAGFLGTLVLALVALHGKQPGIVTTVQAQDQAGVTPACSVASLNGSYGFYRFGTSGVATTNANTLAAVGIMTFDGGGNLVGPGSQTISKNGVFYHLAGNGAGVTYQVDPDCTGRLIAKDGVTVDGEFTIVDGGNGLYLLSETPNNAVYQVARKVRPLGQ